MLITPGGKPHSSTSSANLNNAAGACSEALTTTVFPAAKAGAIFVAERNNCAFQGTMATTTPIGSRVVNTCISGLSIGRTSP